MPLVAVVEDDRGQRQVDGAELLENAQVVNVPQAQAPVCLGNLHPHQPVVAEVEHDVRRNAATLVDEPGVDPIRGVAAQPADQLIGPAPADLGCRGRGDAS